jgi:RNA polymerase sigma-70 factor (ECF subfamily)
LELAHESDERLMQRIAAGQREPLSVLLRRYANPLLTFIRRMSGDHHRSEELFQDVFLAVWSSAHKYRYPRPFRSWLFGIAVKKCQAERRGRGSLPGWMDERGPVAVAGREAAPDVGVIATETATLIEQALMTLPAQRRTVVVMRIWNGFSYGEIAGILECEESTVRSHMFHGLASLRKYLEPRMRSC